MMMLSDGPCPLFSTCTVFVLFFLLVLFVFLFILFVLHPPFLHSFPFLSFPPSFLPSSFLTSSPSSFTFLSPRFSLAFSSARLSFFFLFFGCVLPPRLGFLVCHSTPILFHNPTLRITHSTHLSLILLSIHPHTHTSRPLSPRKQ